MTSPKAAPVTPERIMQLAWGYIPPLMLEAAIRNRVFDLLDGGPMTLAEVSSATGASERGLTALMNALVGLDFLARTDDGLYSLTPESSLFLVRSKPGFQGGIILHTSEQLLPKYLNLNQIVASGKPAAAVNRESDGGEFFRNFVVDIFPMSYPSAQVLGQALGLPKADGPVRVLDLAAGSGVWGIALAQSSAHVTVTAVDWPEVLPVTRATVERFGLSGRFSFVEGDLLSADFGAEHTVATLGHILHSEGEERSRALLAKTYEALASGGTIAIAEFLVNADRRGPVVGLFFAINMLVNTENGNTYSFEEIAGWLAGIGFINARLVEAPGPSPLILAEKP
jgi:hypothetical protein